MKKRLALFLLGIGSLVAVSVNAGNLVPSSQDPAPCVPIPCDTVCAPVPCDTVCTTVPCTPAPCNPGGC